MSEREPGDPNPQWLPPEIALHACFNPTSQKYTTQSTLPPITDRTYSSASALGHTSLSAAHPLSHPFFFFYALSPDHPVPLK